MSGRGERSRPVLASFLMLFVELALIRWAGSNIVYLSYYSNFVLLGSFLGIGIGFLRAGAILARRSALAWAVPPEELLRLSVVPRFVAAVALAFGPVFFANLIFAQRFRDTASSTTAFGANLLGAMVGGLLEYGSLVVGYRSLLILVAVLYALAFATTPATAPRSVLIGARAR